jgi:hypothetical protein
LSGPSRRQGGGAQGRSGRGYGDGDGGSRQWEGGEGQGWRRGGHAGGARGGRGRRAAGGRTKGPARQSQPGTRVNQGEEGGDREVGLVGVDGARLVWELLTTSSCSRACSSSTSGLCSSACPCPCCGCRAMKGRGPLSDSVRLLCPCVRLLVLLLPKDPLRARP